MALVTLKKRAEFLRLRGGARCATPSFVLETRPREAIEGKAAKAPALAPIPAVARFGFTVTKQMGGAVERNRIKRRLKAIAADLASRAHPNHDYVVIARKQALDMPFEALRKDFERALTRVHQPGAGARRKT